MPRVPELGIIILFTELFFNNNILRRPAAGAPIFDLVYRLLNVLFYHRDLLYHHILVDIGISLIYFNYSLLFVTVMGHRSDNIIRAEGGFEPLNY